MKAKVCSKCGIEKNIDRFHKSLDCRFGVRPDCKDCVQAHDKERANGRYMAYVIRMLIDQNFLCACCGKVLTMGTACVDHCHRSGKIRGLLCTICNKWAGIVEKVQSPNDIFIASILNYLSKTEFSQVNEG